MRGSKNSARFIVLILIGGLLILGYASSPSVDSVGELDRDTTPSKLEPTEQSFAIVPPPTFSRQSTLPPTVPNQLLVRFSRDASPAEIQLIAERIGAVQAQSYRTPGLFMFSLPDGVTPQQATDYFQRQDKVELVEEDVVYTLSDIPDDPDFPLQWGLHNLGQDNGVPDVDIDAPEAWVEIQDSGDYVVAIIDSGADLDHPDLVDTLWTNPFEIPDNQIDDDGNGHVDDIHGINQIQFGEDPQDNLGHGTHVAGTIGAAGNNGVGGSGVFWNAQLLHCKVFSSFGWTTLSRILTCMDYVVWAKDAGINVVAMNASWSGGYSQLLSDSVLELGDRDILVVAAAGNDGHDIDVEGWYPAAYPYDNIISVAAMDRTGAIPRWSNVGAQNVDIVAPGVDIWSTHYRDDWVYFSGTSMAAPHVTGVVALTKAATPSLSMAEVRAHVLATGTPDPRYTGLVASGSRVRIVLPFIDSDNDGITDRWELRFGLDPLNSADGAVDTDSDGLSNLEEFQNATDPNNADTDGDGLSDSDEVNIHGSNPKSGDTDGDGLGDLEETQVYGTDPNSADTDSDGWSDFDEINTSGTDPLDGDMDNDGLRDGWELDNGHDPLDPADASQDLDNDGLTSLEEQAVFTDPNNADTDSDSANDGQEVLVDSTDPLDRDTDDDDIDDGWETTFGLDPLLEADGVLDADNDGYSNREEFRADSIPTDPNSVPLPIPWNGYQADSLHSGYVPVHTNAADFATRWIRQLPLQGRDKSPIFGRHSITGVSSVNRETVIAEFDTRTGDLVKTHAVPQGVGPNDLQETLGNLYSLVYETGGSFKIIAINAATGDPVFDPIDIGSNVSPKLTAYGDKLYVKIKAELVEIDALTGVESWRTAIPGVSPQPTSPPAVNDRFVGIVSQSALQVYDRPTGVHRHTIPLETCLQIDDQILFSESSDALVHCFTRLTGIDLEAGVANWSIDTLRSTAIAADPEFVYTTSYLGLHVLDRVTGEHQWTYFSDPNTAFDGNVLVTLDHVFVGDPWEMLAIDLKTHELAWQYELGGATYMNRDGALLLNPEYNNTIIMVDTSSDRDGDGASDWWEKYYGLDFADAANGGADGDGDGLSNAEEFNQGTDPTVSDSDADGLSDGDEVHVHLTDPLDDDSDNDGLSDSDELLVYGTDPHVTDSDDDGFGDGDEVSRGSDPTNATSQPSLRDSYFESFENGMPANWVQPADADVGFAITSARSTDGGFSIESTPLPSIIAEAGIQLTDNFRAGELHFDLFLPADDFGAIARVYVDDRLVADKRDAGWERFQVYVPNGRHTIKVLYDPVGNNSQSMGIDNVRYVRPKMFGSNMDNMVAVANNMLFEIRPDGSLTRAPIWIPGDARHADIVVGPDHRMVVSSSSAALIFDPVLETFTPFEATDLDSPTATIVTPVTATNDSYIVSGVGDKSPLYRFDFNGALRDIVFVGRSYKELQFGKDGWLYGMYSSQGTIDRIDPSSLVVVETLFLETRDSGGIAIEQDGSYYSAFNGNAAGSQVRIERLSPDGTLLATHELETTRLLKDPELSDRGYVIFGGASGEVHRLRKDLRAGKSFTISEAVSHGVNVAVIPASGPDTDLDTLPDWWERANGLDHSDAGDATLDLDNDGLDNLQEFAANGDPNNADTDNDGINDGAEVLVHQSDPVVADTDLDGLDDGDEVGTHGTSPTNGDTDGDGLSDGDEVSIAGSSPLLSDSDGDGIPDLFEFQHHMASNDATDADGDTDGDGLSNRQEFQLGTQLEGIDSDGDGLTDAEEVQNSLSDPLNSDSDDDRMPDGWEYLRGLDPNFDDAVADNDADGFSNVVEFHSQSHPTSPISVPVHAQWEQDQGDIRHRGFVPVQFDFSRFVNQWQTDPLDISTFALTQATVSSNYVLTSTWEPNRFEHFLTALDRETGAVAWQHPYGDASFASPPSNDGVSVFAQTSSHDDSFVYAFDIETGNIRFQTPFPNQIMETRGPAHHDGALYVQSGHFGGIGRYEIDTGAETWRMDHDKGDGHSLTIIDDDVFSYSMEQGLLRINNRVAGQRRYSIVDDAFRWHGYSTYSSIVQGNYDNLMVVYGTGLVSIDLRERKTQWLREFDTAWRLGMALGPGVVYTVEPRALLALDERTGEEIWRWNSARFIQSDPVVTLGHVFVATDATTFAIDIATGIPAWDYPMGGVVSISDDFDIYIAGYTGEIAAVATQLDADGDGISDDWENRFFFNASNSGDALTDADGDGLSQLEEFLARTHPTAVDTDSDLLSDYDEIRVHKTDPLQNDSDGDGLGDAEEIMTFLSDPVRQDSDEDGLDDGHEVNVLGTDPAAVDSDGDSYSDSLELKLGSSPVFAASVPNVVTEFFESFETGNFPPRFSNGSSLHHQWKVDSWTASHGHKVARPDWIETWASAEMIWEDNFADGLLTFDVYSRNSFCCDDLELLIDDQVVLVMNSLHNWETKYAAVPAGHHKITWRFTRQVGNDINQLQTFVDSIRFTVADLDNDGMPGDWELSQGLDPNNAADAAEDPDNDNLTNLEEFRNNTMAFDSDSDDDGMPDGWEVQYNLDPLDRGDRNDDPDADTLTNFEEFEVGTAPNDSDTDNDGMPDGWENTWGLDPLRANGQEDADGDGATNLAEYTAGTNPTDAGSVPPPTGGGGSGGGGTGGGSSGGGGGGSVGLIQILLWCLFVLVRQRRAKMTTPRPL